MARCNERSRSGGDYERAELNKKACMIGSQPWTGTSLVIRAQSGRWQLRMRAGGARGTRIQWHRTSWRELGRRCAHGRPSGGIRPGRTHSGLEGGTNVDLSRTKASWRETIRYDLGRWRRLGRNTMQLTPTSSARSRDSQSASSGVIAAISSISTLCATGSGIPTCVSVAWSW